MPNDFIEAVQQWSINPTKNMLPINLGFSRLTEKQQDCFWTTRTIDTQCDNFILMLASLDQFYPGIFTTINSILVLLPHLDNTIEAHIPHRIQTHALDNIPEYKETLVFQQMMEKIHEHAYNENLTSACYINWTAMKKQFDLKLDKVDPFNLDLRPALINYLQEKETRPIETALAVLANGYTDSIAGYQEPISNIQKLLYDLNLVIIFIKLEWLLLPHLIWTLFRINMIPLSKDLCKTRAYHLLNFVTEGLNKQTLQLDSAQIIHTLLMPFDVPVDLNLKQSMDSHLNLGGIFITNQEILRDEFFHVEISLKAAYAIIEKLLEEKILPSTIYDYVKSMVYDACFGAIIEVIMTLVGETSSQFCNEVQLLRHFSYLMDTALITPMAKHLKIPHTQLQPNNYFHDMNHFLSYRTFTSQHEIKSASYTTTLPGHLTQRSEAL